jgi:uncharacterized protein YbjT (DUF2867 family)
LCRQLSAGASHKATRIAKKCHNLAVYFDSCFEERIFPLLKHGGTTKMTHILLTGATGMLGQQVIEALNNDPTITFRFMRHSAPRASFPQIAARKVYNAVRRAYTSHRAPFFPPSAEWVEADLASGEGLAEAVRDIDVIIHCTDHPQRLLEAARAAQVSHIVAISIVGCDRIPLGYYRQKVAEEEAIRTSGLPFSILRATQFHALIDLILRTSSRFPGIMPLPTDWRFQSIDESEPGRRMAELALASPAGEIQQLGGPQVLSLDDMARTWLALRQMQRRVYPLHIPGQVSAGYRRGDNTCGTALAHGEITWAQWVQQTYQGTPAFASSL